MRSRISPVTSVRHLVPVLSLALIFAACTHDPRLSGSSENRVDTRVAFAPDRVPITWDVRGSGDPALVFIHCWSCDRTFWSEQADVFATEHTVVTLDLPGHGDSGAGRSSWSVTGLAADVEAVVDASGLERVILIGHSMGGPVALAAAARMPGRVEAVVAVDTLHDAEMVWSDEERDQIVGSFDNDFAGAMERFVPMLVHKGADPDLITMMIERGKRVDRKAAVALMRDFSNLDMPGLFSAAGVPIRAINAAPAPPFQPPTAVETNRRYADFEVTLIDEVGHYIQLERPSEFNERLRGVLAELRSRR